MAREDTFTCEIEDFHLQDRFSANVKVVPTTEVSGPSAKPIELANIYITPVSGQLFSYLSQENWRKTPVSFPQARTREKSGVHNHFVLYDFTGHGLYIVRDQHRGEVHRRECSIWDLGQSFAQGVMQALES